MCVRTCAKHWGHRRDIACKALPRGTDLAREGAGRVGMCSRWAIRGGCSEEVSFEQQPHERRRWPGRVRGTPPDGMSQGLRDMKGWPRSPGSTPLASSGCPCRSLPQRPRPVWPSMAGTVGSAWARQPWWPGADWHSGAGGGYQPRPPALRLPGGEWAGQGQGPLPGPSALVGFPVHRGPTVCTTDGRVPASCVSSTAESVKAF